jgi:hypothetical protein
MQLNRGRSKNQLIVTFSATQDYMTTFPTQFLPWIGNWNPSQTLGLFNGTLYDVLQDAALGSGEAKVMATGFNFTCSYPHTVINGVYDSYDSYTELKISVGSYGSINITMPCMSLLIMVGFFLTHSSLEYNLGASAIHFPGGRLTSKLQCPKPFNHSLYTECCS